MRLTSLLALGLLATSCAPSTDAPDTTAAAAPAPLSAADLEAVRAVDAAFAAAMNTKDTTALFTNVYAPDAKVLPPDSPALDMTAARPVLLGLMNSGATNFALNSTEAYGVGDLAYMIGTATFEMGGATQTVKYTEVLRKGADGRWRYVVDMFSNVAPAPAAAH